MGLDDHYRAAFGRARESLDTMITDTETFTSFIATHNLAAELEAIVAVVADRPEAILYQLALREFNHALYEAAGGSYRHAHVGLRMFLELFCAAIYFSAYEVRLRGWLEGLEGSDISWSTLSSADSGVFSNSFLRAFSPLMVSFARQYLTIATTTYRECSEFVHNNYHTQNSSQSQLTYSKEQVVSWMDRAEAVHLCAVFAFAGRYLRILPEEQRERIEGIMRDRLGHIPGIQQIYT